jgi:hypothetical protein
MTDPTEMTLEEYLQSQKKKKPSKYKAKSIELDGYRFDSQAEADRYNQLKLLEHAGVIQNLEIHPVYVLQPKFTTFRGEKVRAIKYEADFEYWEGRVHIVEDVKGVQTEAFKIKQKLFLKLCGNIDFRIVKA